jgi:4-hydroxythreonine-4-phosphate dehydrogenase
MTQKRIVITSGEPAGIGPDLIISLAEQLNKFDCQLLVLGDETLLRTRFDLLQKKSLQKKPLQKELPLNVLDSAKLNESIENYDSKAINLLRLPCQSSSTPGELNPENASYVIDMLDKAIELCTSGFCDAMVTCPIQKSNLIEGGFSIQGHTEYLAEKCDVERVVMLLANEHLRVALATTHIPLSEVSANIKQQDLVETLEIIDQDLQLKFGVDSPKILVCGLNPHAGESGHIGKEEIEIIEPALRELTEQGLDIVGPLSADTIFNESNRKQADAFLAMYHDQGLPVLKALGFGDSINITLGLPIIRTSVDHGTALALAGTGEADNRSLLRAIDCAIQLSQNREDGQA